MLGKVQETVAAFVPGTVYHTYKGTFRYNSNSTHIPRSDVDYSFHRYDFVSGKWVGANAWDAVAGDILHLGMGPAPRIKQVVPVERGVFILPDYRGRSVGIDVRGSEPE